MIIWKKTRKKTQILTIIILFLTPTTFYAGYILKAVGIYADLVDKPLSYEPDPTAAVGHFELANVIQVVPDGAGYRDTSLCFHLFQSIGKAL